jgi:hypothetical protein
MPTLASFAATFGTLLGTVSALLCIAVLTVSPLLFVWLALSIRRDVRRIADALTTSYGSEPTRRRIETTPQVVVSDETQRRISLSALGR